jgi:hypothetical protein
MPTQRFITATFAGKSAEAVEAQFACWRASPNPVELDQFCQSVRDNAVSLVLIHYTEWIDRWSSGYHHHSMNALDGKQYSAAILTPDAARAFADSMKTSVVEHEWFVQRLRDAAHGWGGIGEPYRVVVIREVLAPLAEDHEIETAVQTVPAWLLLLASVEP